MKIYSRPPIFNCDKYRSDLHFTICYFPFVHIIVKTFWFEYLSLEPNKYKERIFLNIVLIFFFQTDLFVFQYKYLSVKLMTACV